MSAENNMPAIRFKGFSGGWEVKILKDLTKINQGLQIAISNRYPPVSG
jgi:type I restriction enzyme S subunit